METRENLSQEEIANLEKRSKEWGGKSIRLYTKDELLDEADPHHIWLKAFACINPTQQYCQELGASILNLLAQSDMRDFTGISREIIITINKS
jgi:hypothetical protein